MTPYFGAPLIPTLSPGPAVLLASGNDQTLANLLPAGHQRAATVQQARPDGGGVRLQVQLAGQLIELRVQSPLPQGTAVLLMRDSSGQIRLSLAPAQPTPAPQPQATPGQTPVTADAQMDSVLRTSLPRQQPLADVLGQLSQLSARLQQTQQGPNMAASARQADPAIQTVLQSVLQMFGIRPGNRDSAAVVRRNTEKGGFFTEAQLARSLGQSQPPTPDLKSHLGQLQQLADALPPEAREQMRKLLDDLLARITTHQVTSAAQGRDLPDGGTERHVALDLPIRIGEQMENVELLLKRHRASDKASPAESHWLIRLHFELEELGNLEAELKLRDDASMSARFWASKAETATLVDSKLADFAAGLNQQGIQIDNLSCQQGTPPRTETGIRRQLINLKT